MPHGQRWRVDFQLHDPATGGDVVVTFRSDFIHDAFTFVATKTLELSALVNSPVIHDVTVSMLCHSCEYSTSSGDLATVKWVGCRCSAEDAEQKNH